MQTIAQVLYSEVQFLLFFLKNVISGLLLVKGGELV